MSSLLTPIDSSELSHNKTITDQVTDVEDHSEGTVQELQLKRGLKNRHVSFLALAGIIGPGILVGASAMTAEGPLSLIVGFGVVGLIAFAMVQSLGELATLYPLGNVLSTLGNKLFDQAIGGALGWNYVIIWVAVLANEYNMVASIMSYWIPQVPLYGHVLMFWAFFLVLQFMAVSKFGEMEFWLALFKIVGIVAFYIFSIVYAAGGVKGQEAIGFRYWHEPGPLAHGFRSIVSTLVFASTFYSGTEIVAIAASETSNPRKAIPTAIRQTFVRIIIIYMGIGFFYGLTVPYNAPELASENDTLKSPMTVAIMRAGWAGGVNLVNAFILVTCVSAINSCIYIGSRTVVHLAHEGSAPRIFARINKAGVPYFAVLGFNACGMLLLMNISTGAAQAYYYIVNLSGVAVFIVWGGVNVYHFRFRRAWAFQGRSVDELPYRALWYPALPIFGVITNTFLALIQGWDTLKPFRAADFVDAYILFPFFFVLVGVLKLATKSKWQHLAEIDLDDGRRADLDDFEKPL